MNEIEKLPLTLNTNIIGLRFIAPDSSRFLGLLASRLTGEGHRAKITDLYINEHGIWPSEENKPLFFRLLAHEPKSSGSIYHIHLSTLPRDIARGILFLCFVYGWGGLLVQDGDVDVIFNHDGEFLINKDNESQLSLTRDLLDAWKVEWEE